MDGRLHLEPVLNNASGGLAQATTFVFLQEPQLAVAPDTPTRILRRGVAQGVSPIGAAWGLTLDVAAATM